MECTQSNSLLYVDFYGLLSQSIFSKSLYLMSFILFAKRFNLRTSKLNYEEP